MAFCLVGPMEVQLSYFRKQFADQITVVDCAESRITGIHISTNKGPLLLLNVYIPTNYNDDFSLEKYIECLSYLHALMTDADAVHTLHCR